MSDPVEQRQFARRACREEIFCYVDGERLDAQALDVSAGGLLLETDRGDDVQVGALVAVVFRARVDETGSIFLFGRVVRRHTGERSGLAVRWDKAAGPVPRERLAQFLREVLHVRPFGIEQGTIAGSGQTMSVFRFVPEPLDAEGEVHGGRVENPVGPELYRGLRAEWRRYPEPGPVTQEIEAAEFGVETNMAAALIAGGIRTSCRVVWLATSRLRVQGDDLGVDLDQEVEVEFGLPAREGPIAVACSGIVRQVRAGGAGQTGSVVVAVRYLDEGSSRGVLRRYVRWLHAREIARG